MTNGIDPKCVYIPSEDVVSRQIDDEFLLVPIASGIGDMEDELYTLNETGRIIWQRMSADKTIEDIAAELSLEYDASKDIILADICGIVGELFKLNMVVKVDK